MGYCDEQIEKFAKPIIKHFGWNMHAATVIHGDTLVVSKPNPEPLLMAAEQLKTNPKIAYTLGYQHRCSCSKSCKNDNIIVGYGWFRSESKRTPTDSISFHNKGNFSKSHSPSKN